VTQVSECGQRHSNPFLEVLSRPGALRFSAAGVLGRMPISMFGLGTLLLVASLTGRYGLAGLVSAADSVGYAVCAPQAARLADRFGQSRVLRPQVLFCTAATTALVACAELRAPDWALLLTAALAGASMPSLGSMVRTRWIALLGDSPLLHSAFSLESVLDELIFVIGPALVTVLATEVQPASGVTLAMAACVVGTLLLAAQRGTEPPVAPPALAGPAARPAHDGRTRRFRIELPAPGLITLAPVYLLLGAMFGTIDLSVVAFSEEHGHKPLAGLILGTYALGSAAGGLWYGSRTWRTPLHRRFATTLTAVCAGTATFWAMPGLGTLASVIFFCGLAISPTLISGFSLIEQQAMPARRTEGLTWLTSAISVGVATGSAVAGHLVDAGGARWGFWFAAASGAGAVAACLLGLRWLRVPAREEPAEWADAGR
jgi:MFS family permease